MHHLLHAFRVLSDYAIFVRWFTAARALSINPVAIAPGTDLTYGQGCPRSGNASSLQLQPSRRVLPAKYILPLTYSYD